MFSLLMFISIVYIYVFFTYVYKYSVYKWVLVYINVSLYSLIYYYFLANIFSCEKIND